MTALDIVVVASRANAADDEAADGLDGREGSRRRRHCGWVRLLSAGTEQTERSQLSVCEAAGEDGVIDGVLWMMPGLV